MVCANLFKEISVQNIVPKNMMHLMYVHTQNTSDKGLTVFTAKPHKTARKLLYDQVKPHKTARKLL